VVPDLSDVVSLGVGSVATWRIVKWARPWSRHKHVWKVVGEPKQITPDGESITFDKLESSIQEKMIKAAQEQGAWVTELLEGTSSRSHYLVHYECYCGSEKFDRV
jgi:hypothetical protein